MAADSAAMFRRMSFDRGGDPAGVPRLHLILCRSATVVQTSPQAGSGTGEEQEDEQMGEGKASSSQHDRIRCIASCCRFLTVHRRLDGWEGSLCIYNESCITAAIAA